MGYLPVALRGNDVSIVVEIRALKDGKHKKGEGWGSNKVTTEKKGGMLRD
jgi:hypothetical protein